MEQITNPNYTNTLESREYMKQEDEYYDRLVEEESPIIYMDVKYTRRGGNSWIDGFVMNKHTVLAINKFWEEVLIDYYMPKHPLYKMLPPHTAKGL